MLVMSQMWTRSEKKNTLSSRANRMCFFFANRIGTLCVLHLEIVLERPCLPFARFTAFLGFGFLGKAPSTKCWHIWTFSQPWFFLLIREVVIGWELLTLVLALWPWRSASPENRQQRGHVFLFNVSLVNHFSFQTSMRHYQLVNIFVGQVNIVPLTS